MITISDETVVRQASTVHATTIDGEAVMLESESGTYYGFNETATYIWNRVEDPTTVAEIREAMLAEYAVDPEQCERDVRDAVGTMVDNGLVELED